MTVAVGFFDGVHLGHQAILKDADLAVTFKNHPLSVLAPHDAPRLLMSLDERVAAIRACGVREVVVLDFTSELAAMSAADFAKAYLAPSIRCGQNWRFGAGGEGDAAYLRRLGYAVEEVPYAEFDGAIVSSTRIRTALEAGEIESANTMLGRRFAVVGRAFKGKGEGAKLGFPTMNFMSIGDVDKVRLPRGVYEVSVRGLKAVANYGVAPTFAAKAWSEPVWEVHLIQGCEGWEAREAESMERLELVRYLRPERKFASLAELKRQIAIDCGIISP